MRQTAKDRPIGRSFAVYLFISVSGKFLFYLCFELFCLQKLGKQLSLLDKREYPKGEGV